MKRFFVVLTTLLIAFGCSKYDDTAIKSDISDLKNRVSSLESLCNQMNSNISTLKSAVEALQKGYYVSEVQEFDEGYKIIFSNGQSISIYNGKDGRDGKDGKDGVNGQNGKDGRDGIDGQDGSDGNTPVVGVAQYTDGNYYWTLNGSWLLDNKGNMIPATGENGKDGHDGKDGADGTDGADGQNGVTPQLKIEDGNWFVSTDNGATWAMLGRAVGEDGDTMFSSVTQDDEYVYLILASGEEIKLPKECTFTISFEDTIFYPKESSMSVPFTIKGAGEDLRIVTFADNTISASIELSSKTAGKVKVEFLDESLSGTVLVAAKSNGHSAMEILDFEKGVISTEKDAFLVPAEGGDITMTVSHNMDITFSSDSNWITEAGTKAIMTESFKFAVTANNGDNQRVGYVTFKSDDGEYSLSFKVVQLGHVTNVISAAFIGGAITSIDGKIWSGSTLNWQLNNNSANNIHLKTMKILDWGDEKKVVAESNIDTDIEAYASPAWSYTVDWRGIYSPVVVFTYDLNGEEKYAAAAYDNTIDLTKIDSVWITEGDGYYIPVGASLELKITAAPFFLSPYDLPGIEWESSNPAVATVKDGVLTAVGAGTAKISVGVGYKTYVDEIAVTIVDPDHFEQGNVLTYSTDDQSLAGEFMSYYFGSNVKYHKYFEDVDFAVAVFENDIVSLNSFAIDNGISKGVTRVVFPQTVSSVGYAPFWECDKVTYVRFQGTESPTFESFFWGLSENAIVYVPKGSKDSYIEKLGTENADRIVED